MSSKKTVLIVDDEEGILYSLQRILELSGNYEIITALNGKEALKKIDRLVPDLIVSDIAMPEMDGLDLCRKIRTNELTRNVPFIFLTARKELMVDGLKAGGDDFIKKPFTFDEVIAKIEAIFRRVKNTKEQANQIKGNLAEQNVDRLLNICSKSTISGSIILQKKAQIGEIKLNKGEIVGVSLAGLPEDKALDTLRNWHQGIFIIRPEGIQLKADFIRQYQNDDASMLAEPVEIAPDTWWVGYRRPNNSLQLNVYLRRFSKDRKVIHLIVDPGSSVDFPFVSKKISRIIGNISRVNLYSLSEGDPDVAMNAVFIRNANPKAICLTSEENWRFIEHYEIPRKSVKLVDKFKKGVTQLTTGHQIQFIPVPFCHGRGAFMIYDPETRVLFSGDLFGGLTDAKRIYQLYSEEADWDGIRAFHQLYMPTRTAIQHAIEKIRQIDPPPMMIAPQHGTILRGELMEQFMDRLFQLDVGVDLFRSRELKEQIQHYLDAANELIEESTSYIALDRITEKLLASTFIASAVAMKNGKITEIFSRPEDVFQQITNILLDGEDDQVVNQIKSFALKISRSHGFPAPNMDWEYDRTISTTPPDLFEE